ncbi:MAG: cellulase family glycosylhydrolase [Acidimicrobiales bacterium]
MKDRRRARDCLTDVPSGRDVSAKSGRCVASLAGNVGRGAMERTPLFRIAVFVAMGILAVIAMTQPVSALRARDLGVSSAARKAATCSPGATAASAACGPVGPIRSQGGPFLRDAYGRAVILHGVNAVYKRPPYELYAAPGMAWSFTSADARAIASLGFDVVRLGILWQGIEPGGLPPNSPGICAPGSPGHAHQWNQATADAYLSKVQHTVDLLGRYGIFTLLDMHQDVYNQAFAGEGAPSWAVCTNGIPPTNTGNWVANYTEAAVAAAYSHFWNNNVVGNLQGNYDRAWRAVARRFAGNPDVLGYDLFNEPFSSVASLGGPGTATFDARLECFYTGTEHPGRLSGSRVPLVCPPDDPRQGVIPTIRSVDPSHPIFYEPDVSSDWGNVDWIGPMPYRHLVLDFHDYCITQSVAQLHDVSAGCPVEEQQTFTSQAGARSRASDAANPGGPAWFMSEFGAEPANSDLANMVALADHHLVGWSYWQWKYYGDPTGNSAEALAGTDPATGDPVVDTAKAAILSQPYVQAVAGTPTYMSYSAADDTFHLSYHVDPSIHQPTVVFVPVGIHYRSGYCARVRGAQVVSAPGASHLALRAVPGAMTVDVTITAGRCIAPGPPPTGSLAAGHRRSLVTFGVIPPQLPTTGQWAPTLDAVGMLAQGRPFLVHLYTNWADYPGSLPALDSEIARYSARGLEIDLALRYVPPPGHNGDVAGFASFVESMVAHYADQPAVAAFQVTNEANSPVNPAASDGAYRHAESALVAGIEAGATERAKVGSHATLGFNWFYSFGPTLDRAWWARLGVLGGRRFAGDVNWVGVDAYPGTYYPPVSPLLDPTDPAAGASREMMHILSTVRSELMPLAGLGFRTPLGMSEIGWATLAPLRSDAEQAKLVTALTRGVCKVAARDNVTFLQWYDLVDTAGAAGGSSLDFGLMHANFLPKPAFGAFRTAVGRDCGGR